MNSQQNPPETGQPSEQGTPNIPQESPVFTAPPILPPVPPKYPYPGQQWQGQQPPPVYPPVQAQGIGYSPVFNQQIRYDPNPRRTESVKRLNRTSMICLAQTAFSFVWQLLFMFLFMLIDRRIMFTGLPEYLYNWLSGAMIPLSTLLPAVIYIAKTKMDLTHAVRFEHRSLWFTLLGTITGFGICLLGNFPAIAIESFLENLGLPSRDMGPTSYDPSSSWMYILAVAVLAPFIEEFVFRGIILTRLEVGGKWFAVIGSAFIFGIAHGDLAKFAFAFVAGLVFGFLYVKTRNLWVPIVVHFLNNSLAIVQQYARLFLEEQDAIVLNIITFYGPMVLGLIALGIMLLLKRKEVFTLREPEQLRQDPHNIYRLGGGLTAGDSFGAMVRSAGIWVIFAGMLIMTVYTRLP